MDLVTTETIPGREIDDWLFDESEQGSETRSAGPDVDAVEELKRRYADGEIDDDEFERRLDRLLEADDAVDRASTSAQGPTPAESRVAEGVETDQRERAADEDR